MKAGSAIAILAVVGYLGFEGYAFSKASHRMQPDYIYDLLVRAQTATLACNAATESLQERFNRTLQRTENSYTALIMEQQPQQELQAVNLLIKEKAAIAQREVEQELASAGCASPEMRKHVRRYEIYASKTR